MLERANISEGNYELADELLKDLEDSQLQNTQIIRPSFHGTHSQNLVPWGLFFS